MAIDSGLVNWMQRVFPVLANQGPSRPPVPDRQPVVPRSFPEGDQQQWHRSGAFPDAALRAVVGPRSGNKGRWATKTSLKTGKKNTGVSTTYGGSFLPATQAYCLTCEHDAEGSLLAGKTWPFATEAGRINSKLLAEVSRQRQVASSARLFKYRARLGMLLARPMIGGVLSEIDFDTTTYLVFLCKSRGGGSTSSLRALF